MNKILYSLLDRCVSITGCTYSAHDRMNNEVIHWQGCGSGRDLLKIISRHLIAGIEEGHKNSVQLVFRFVFELGTTRA